MIINTFWLIMTRKMHNKQLLIDHLFEVSKLAKNTGKLINLSSICELIGILHDFGKYENLYQNTFVANIKVT